MKVKCYEEGGDPEAEGEDYDLTGAWQSRGLQSSLLWAAREFAQWRDDGDLNVVVVPVDNEARAIPGWRSDDDEPQHRLFAVKARVEWNATEVDTFNPYARTA